VQGIEEIVFEVKAKEQCLNSPMKNPLLVASGVK
jgi:hypothetical protein